MSPRYKGTACIRPGLSHGGISGVGLGQRGQLSPGAGLGGPKIGDQKVFLKLFRNNSERLPLVRLGHRNSINQSNRLQLTKISFPVVLSCFAYIHSGYLYSAPSRNLLRRNLRFLNRYRRLGSLVIPCDPGTITESSICSKFFLRNVSLIRCYINDQDFLRSGQLNSTFAPKLRHYLSPAYLFPRYSTTSPFGAIA